MKSKVTYKKKHKFGKKKKHLEACISDVHVHAIAAVLNYDKLVVV